MIQAPYFECVLIGDELQWRLIYTPNEEVENKREGQEGQKCTYDQNAMNPQNSSPNSLDGEFSIKVCATDRLRAILPEKRCDFIILYFSYAEPQTLLSLRNQWYPEIRKLCDVVYAGASSSGSSSSTGIRKSPRSFCPWPIILLGDLAMSKTNKMAHFVENFMEEVNASALFECEDVINEEWIQQEVIPKIVKKGIYPAKAAASDAFRKLAKEQKLLALKEEELFETSSSDLDFEYERWDTDEFPPLVEEEEHEHLARWDSHEKFDLENIEAL